MIELINLRKDYKERILDDINLKLNLGEFITILGPSGSGKTTLLKIIGMLLSKTKGTISINNIDYTKLSEKDIDYIHNKEIGFIYQNYNLIDNLTVLENILLPQEIKGNKDYTKACNLLNKVGLLDKMNENVNNLSGGEKQRVAIARALINNPKIILADEPTGALDSVTSIEIMNLLKSFSKERLIIVVTHNKYLAKMYATRIINLKDGKIIKDEVIKKPKEVKELITISKTKYHLKDILKISIRNLFKNKGRTIATIIAFSIGITSLTLTISLTNGFNKEVIDYERQISKSIPITITSMLSNKDNKNYINTNEITKDTNTTNNLNKEMYEYIKKIDTNLISGVSISSNTNTFLPDIKKEIIPVTDFNSYTISNYLETYYDLIKGNIPTSKEEVLLIVNKDNSINETLYNKLNIIDNNLDNIINKELKLDTINLKIVGIIKIKEELYKKLGIDDEGSSIMYTKQLEEYLNNTSTNNFENTLISIYPKDFKSIDEITNYLDNYKDTIPYINESKILEESTNTMLNSITIILLLLSSISLIVSSIMQGIITYINVLERKKEIGILKTLGTSKKEIRKLFNLESILIGFISSTLGITMSNLISIPINKIVYNTTSIINISRLNITNIITIIILSSILSLLGGLLSSKKASKLDVSDLLI